MERKIIDVKTNRHVFLREIAYKEDATFDDLIAFIERLKQQYLEDSFLYKRNVTLVFDTYSAVIVKVSRLETDKELEARIKKSEKARQLNEAKKQKRDESELNKKISEYKKLHSELSIKVPNLEKIIIEGK